MKLKAFVHVSSSEANHWYSTMYPQINIAYKEIEERYYWDCHTCENEVRQ